MALKAKLVRGGLDVLYHSGVYRALEPVARGIGVIFTLHRVYPRAGDQAGERFAPNAVLEVGPGFLGEVITRVRERGFDVISLDEARVRLMVENPRRFAVFTLDDGYRDTLEFARPVFADHDCPFTVFVASGFADRTARLWWVALERAIDALDAFQLTIAGKRVRCACASVAGKNAAWEAVYWPLRAAGEAERHDVVAALAARAGIDMAAITDELTMDWDLIKRLAADRLVTIGAHTVSHPTLAHLGDTPMRRELIEGRARLTAMLGDVPRHLAYPYGDEASAGAREFEAAAELGFATAVTTRKGMIHPEHADYLTALPRISLNGAYQSLRYVDLFLSGAPFALANRFRHVDAA